MPPTVSVVLNCYNHEAWVAEAIDSVLRQTFADLELIIIDNGSTDDSRAVIQGFDDPRIKLLLNNDNQPISRRLNQGIAAAEGEFVSILYSDDFFLPHKLERQAALFRALPADVGVVYGPSLGVNDRTGERWQLPSAGLSGTMLPALFYGHFKGGIDMSAPLVRRQCYERFPFIETVFAEGEAIFFRIALGWRFHFDPEPLMVLRDHGGNMGKAVKANHDMLMASLDALESDSDFRPSFKAPLDDFRSNIFRNHAWLMLRMGSGDDDWIRDKLIRSLRLRPRQLLQPRLLAAMILAALPFPLRRAANRAANCLRARPENRNLIDGYR